MVTILPPKTDLGTAIGTALGSGLGQGIQKGSNIGFQRGILENALKDVNNIPPELKALLIGTSGLCHSYKIACKHNRLKGSLPQVSLL